MRWKKKKTANLEEALPRMDEAKKTRKQKWHKLREKFSRSSPSLKLKYVSQTTFL